MNISLLDNKLFIDNQEVNMVIFKDGSYVSFPLSKDDKLNSDNNVTLEINGNNSIITTEKNVLKNVSIKCNGSFHLGDK